MLLDLQEVLRSSVLPSAVSLLYSAKMMLAAAIESSSLQLCLLAHVRVRSGQQGALGAFSTVSASAGKGVHSQTSYGDGAPGNTCIQGLTRR